MESNIRNYAVRSVKPRSGSISPWATLPPLPSPSKPGSHNSPWAGARPAGRGASPCFALGPARPPSYRCLEAGPPPELSGAEVPAPSLPTPATTMDTECAASRLRVVLGHLRRPSAANVVSFGLRWAPAGRGAASRAIAQSPRPPVVPLAPRPGPGDGCGPAEARGGGVGRSAHSQALQLRALLGLGFPACHQGCLFSAAWSFSALGRA